jgi:hypothetical protein
MLKKKIICLMMTDLLMAVLSLPVRSQDLLISGDFQDVSLLSFVDMVERDHPVKFFFDPESIEGIFISAEFQETPLQMCLESILSRERLRFHISENNQVTIYTGNALKKLMPGEQPIEVIRKESAPEEKLSRERLKRLQYQILNIGTPGRSTSGYAVVSGYLTCFETGMPVRGGNIYIAETRRGVIRPSISAALT